MYRTVGPKQALELLKSGYRFVDVRTTEEFAEGHPEGAVNVPILTAGMVPNDDFLRVMEANFPKDARLVLGCKSGGRSGRAAGVLEEAGYADVVNMDGGFHGRYDGAGRMVQPGWSQEGLPTSQDSDEDARYESLARKVEEE